MNGMNGMSSFDIVKTAVGNSFRNKLRTTMTVVAIFIGAFTLTLTSAIGTGVSSYLDVQLASVGAADVLTVSKTAENAAALGDGPAPYDPAQATAAGMASPEVSVLTRDDLDAIAATDGLRSVSAVVTVQPRYIEYDNNGKYQLVVSEGTATAMTRADLAAGEQLSDTNDENQILLPAAYLDNLGFEDAASAIGESVMIGITDHDGTMHEVVATVVGVQNLTLLGVGGRFNQALTYGLDLVQNSGMPAGSDRGYLLATAHFDESASQEQISAIKADLADQGYTAQTVADLIGVYQSILTGIVGVLNGFAVIALIAAGFGIINTLVMSVQERTREIGLMKAMGMSGGKVYALFSVEAIFIGMLGSAIGALVAIVTGVLISNALSSTVLADLEGLQVMQFTPASVGGIIAVVMLIAFLAGTLPARRAARQNSIDALRYE
ncbi:ABC transporter permease [Salinibacterium sp. ZJ450]|uniref:ABC transporter permease n=1 Tax=Salinibacterium sp. ZJ450 TaxID=2708338 RepID=UPI001CD54DDF|nr:ABC transporter permease [Salinibacterium sp. ZJ450]